MALRPNIVCVCGSTRFIDVMAVKMWEFEKVGEIALGCHLLPPWYSHVQSDHQAEAEGVAAILDRLHLKKIEIADRVFVCNVGGYIGDQTKVEIEHAKRFLKPITYLEPLP